MKNWKQWLAGLLMLIASALGGGYTVTQMSESPPAQYEARESYGTAYKDGQDHSGAKYAAVYDVDIYWSVEVLTTPQNGLPSLKVPVPYFAKHTVEIADKVTDDKIAAALKGKAPFQNSTFVMLWNYKLIRYTKREADSGDKPTGMETE